MYVWLHTRQADELSNKQTDGKTGVLKVDILCL